VVVISFCERCGVCDAPWAKALPVLPGARRG
jgi:hypothetical protein